MRVSFSIKLTARSSLWDHLTNQWIIRPFISDSRVRFCSPGYLHRSSSCCYLLCCYSCYGYLHLLEWTNHQSTDPVIIYLRLLILIHELIPSLSVSSSPIHSFQNHEPLFLLGLQRKLLKTMRKTTTTAVTTMNLMKISAWSYLACNARMSEANARRCPKPNVNWIV